MAACRSEANLPDAVNLSSLDSHPADVDIESENVLDLGSIEEQSSLDGEGLKNKSSLRESTTSKQWGDPDDVAHRGHDNTFKQESSAHAAGEDVAAVDHTPLSYQIPEDLLRTAMLASPNTRASFWSTKLYRGPQGESLATHYCQSMEVADRVAQYFLNEKIVGFDIEWKPRGNPFSIKQNASLIQLACENRIALFHISLFPGTKAEQLMPPNLKAVLESPNIFKVGVAVKGDFRRLEKYLGIQAQGVFELSRLHNLVEWYEKDPSKISHRLVGLAAQVLQHLQLPLYKGAPLDDEPDNTSSVRESDWSQPLDLQQIHYAAADAYAGFRLYHTLEWKRNQLNPTPSAIKLCDFDSKPASRLKEPRKSTKATGKPEAAVETATDRPTNAIDQGQDEAEDTEDLDGYETAPEELMDSHQLEDPVPKSSSPASAELDQIEAQTQTCFGQLNSLHLRGPDLSYPVLPHDSNRTVTSTPLTRSFDRSSTGPVKLTPVEDVFHSKSLELGAEEDEYADSELEEALRTMELDDGGNFRKDLTENITDVDFIAEVPNKTPTFKPLVTLPKEDDYTTEYALATTWAQNYVKTTIPLPASTAPSRIRATIPHLRAYHLWYHQKLSVDDIASHLREPPLSISTVTSYILQAVSLEGLEYDKKSLNEVMKSMSPGLRNGRWKWLAAKAGALD